MYEWINGLEIHHCTINVAINVAKLVAKLIHPESNNKTTMPIYSPRLYPETEPMEQCLKA
jgi:hypothetical protein